MNTEQFNQCVDMHSDALYRFALKNLKDEDEAREIVQISFEKLWIRRQEVDYERVRSYLFTTGYHAMVDFWRRQKRSSEMTPELENTVSTPAQEYKGLKGIIEKALKQLPDVQKSVLLLRDYEGYSYEEIGEITGLNESQVKVYIFRARQTLKQVIGNLEAVL
ncbi:MAG: RNA polymerase sigma factor [Bacteroidetes bacterium]|nr:RNA polymerase sigma factor [Bacteroidota bacterium]